MINLNDVKQYCTSEKVVEYADFTKDKIKHSEDTYAFVYVGLHGMQFEEENDNRYIEFDISEEEKGVCFSIYIDYNNGKEREFDFDNIEEAIKKWNELY